MAEPGCGDGSLWPVPSAVPALNPGEIQLFALALDLSPRRLAALEPSLSETELARAGRFRFDRDRGRYVAGRGQLRAILGRYLRRAPGGLRLDSGRFGKPALEAGSEDRIRFNLSRSADLGIVAIQLNEDLGVDVEQVRPFTDALAIAKRMFAAEEYQALSSLPETEQLEGFFRYWTRKEAVVKSVGRGLTHPLDGFVLSPDSGEERVVVERDGTPVARWLVPVPPPRADFVVALATGSLGPVRCWAWTEG